MRVFKLQIFYQGFQGCNRDAAPRFKRTESKTILKYMRVVFPLFLENYLKKSDSDHNRLHVDSNNFARFHNSDVYFGNTSGSILSLEK